MKEREGKLDTPIPPAIPVAAAATAAAAAATRSMEPSNSGVIVKRPSSRPQLRGATPEANDRDRRVILVASEAIITEKGFARATVEDICERAKLDTDVFYSHFPGMGAMLRALSTQFMEQMHIATENATKSGIWSGAPARDVLEVAVRTIIDVVVDRRGLVRALLSHGATDEALMVDLRSIGTHMAQRLVAVFAECTNVPTRPSRAVAFSLLVAVSLAHHSILVGDEWSGVSFSKEQLAEECSQTICAYLGLKPTISMREETPDLAMTAPIHHLDTDECEAVHDEDPEG